MVADGVVELIVTDCVVVYVPATGLKVGVAAADCVGVEVVATLLLQPTIEKKAAAMAPAKIRCVLKFMTILLI
jgi:hypothetical protein